MKFTLILSTLAVLAHSVVSAVGVIGAAEGFAKGVTGGGSATPVYPKTNAELVKYLGDSSPRVIVLTKTFDFTGSEGYKTETGCAPWGTGAGCQQAINLFNWCSPSYKKVSVTYDKTPILPITVKSNKSLIGVGSAGVIKGKGMRMVSGARNIIIQNIKITGLNPQYVWGGDAISLSGTDLIWIDHVTTSLIGRQHIVLGNDANTRVTISNSFIDGRTSWSPSCDGYHYWALFFNGANDLVTFKNNYIFHTNGRSPKVGGNTLLHAVNNYWYDNNQHAFEIATGANVLAEGNIFQNVAKPVEAGWTGKLFTGGATQAGGACEKYIGRRCMVNGFGSSGQFKGVDTSFFPNFSGKNIAAATTGEVAKAVMKTAGHGKI